MQKFKDTRAIHDYIVAARCETGRATIYTDGACDPNPGPGGWGFIIRIAGLGDIEHYGGAADTTNNRMEMMALAPNSSAAARMRVVASSRASFRSSV